MSQWETTVKAVTLALNAASLKQQTIAANIANAGVDGFARREVSFDSQLDAARQSLARTGALAAGDLDGVAPKVTLQQNLNGSVAPVQIDQEMAAMAENSVRYQMLVKALNRQMSILAIAAGDGKR